MSVTRIKTKDNTPPPTRTVLGENVAVGIHRLLGQPLLFYGANREEKCFLVRDDGGNDHFFRVIAERRRIVDIVEEPLPDDLPKGIREDDLGPVVVVEYDKWDDEQPAEHYGEATWNKGYRFLDMRTGVAREWLRVGLDNYKRKPRVVFKYRGHEDMDEDDED